MHFAIDDATLQVEFAQFVADFEEKIVHEQQMHLADVLHFHSVDAIYFRNQALLILPEVLYVLWQRLHEHSLLVLVHRLDQKSFVETRKHKRTTLAS